MRITKENLGTMVQRQRSACGMTQSQLAQRAGCSQRLVSELERGSSVRIDKAIDVFEALGLSLVVEPALLDAHQEIEALESRVKKSLTRPPQKRKLADYL